MEAEAWPIATIVRGVLVMMEGALVAPGRGEPVRFVETLPHALTWSNTARVSTARCSGSIRAMDAGRPSSAGRCWCSISSPSRSFSSTRWCPGTTACEAATGIWLWVDIFIAAVITLDFLARFYIERHKWRFFTRWSNIADLVVVATLLLPMFLQNLVFLRVLRVVRLLRAFEYLHREHGVSTWLHRNAFVISKVVNLIVFIFLVTALVFVTQIDPQPGHPELSRCALFHRRHADDGRARRHHAAGHVRPLDHHRASWCWA